MPHEAEWLHSLSDSWTPAPGLAHQGTSPRPSPPLVGQAKKSVHKELNAKHRWYHHIICCYDSTAYLTWAPPSLTDVERNAVGLLLSGNQVHVVGNEKLPCSCHRGTPAWHKLGWTEIWSPLWLSQLRQSEWKQASMKPSIVWYTIARKEMG